MTLQEYLKAVKERAEAATEVVYKLCDDPKSFTMCIPARPDDADIVLCDSLKDAEVLLEMVEKLLEQRDDWVRFNHEDDWYDVMKAENQELDEIIKKHKDTK